MLLLRSLYVALLTAVLLSSAATSENDGEVTAEVNPLYYRCREDGGRYAPGSTYLSNLKALYGVLVAKASTSNFASGAVGEAPDAVYGVVLCRGDYGGAPCAESLQKAFANAVDKGFVCPLYKDVTIYYDQHMLRFSGDDFRRRNVSGNSNRPAWVAWNMNNVTGAAGRSYGEKVRTLASAIVDAAARSPDRYATGEVWFGREDVSKVYGLMQCWPEFTAEDCRSCLADLVSLMPEWFSNSSTVITVSAEGFLASDSQAQNELEEWTKLLAAEIGSMFSLFTLSEIINATDNFSEAKRLGEGAFGPVYRVRR
ncbi:hypothetical protein EJB05_16005, partial [Eragrostis curvula]